MKVLLIGALSLLLASCAATTPRIEPARLGEVQKGRTTAAEVVRQFGMPSVLSKNPDGTQSATYVHGDRQSGASAIVPLVAIVPRDSVTFYFDANGLLTDVKTTQAGPLQASAGNAPQVGGADAGKAQAGKPGSSQPAPAGVAQDSNTRSWWLPGWLPPPTTENR